MSDGIVDLQFLSNIDAGVKYSSWLHSQVDENEEFTHLILYLHFKKFLWSVPNDDNRTFDGKTLRIKFCDECKVYYDQEQYEETCSMLELIIGLAYRCRNMMADTGNDNPMKYWFWKFLSNVGLDKFSDKAWVDSKTEYKVDSILNKIIDRTYEKDGKGGLFPLKNAKKDQRKVELWYQMNAYLVEKYYNREDMM
ncbi:MAG: hypothetical protein K0S61_156 [Anaerocolumna sp.]|jgi:hypothetical protein|nr:hypothetical protein [Anaerocolumna sp.]